VPDIQTDHGCRGGFETRPYVRLSRPIAIIQQGGRLELCEIAQPGHGSTRHITQSPPQ
jgi:hypothetical protein